MGCRCIIFSRIVLSPTISPFGDMVRISFFAFGMPIYVGPCPDKFHLIVMWRVVVMNNGPYNWITPEPTITRTVPIKFKRLYSHNLSLPKYQTAGAAGFDLQACLIDTPRVPSLFGDDFNCDSITLHPGEKRLVHTGFAVAVADGHELQIRPRSGLALTHEIIILNSPGTIDADYRGEIIIGLKNLSTQPFLINHGMRIAQAVLAPVVRVQCIEVTELDSTTRGIGGFGSTGY